MRAILANPVYVKLEIIDAETWEKAEALRSARARTKGKGRGRTADRHLFRRGFLRCECSEAFIPRTYPNRRSEDYEVYVCYGHDKLGTCSMPPLRRAEIDGAVYGYFEQVGLDVEATRAQFAEARNRKLAEVRALREDGERQLAKVREGRERVERDYLSGELSAESHDRLTARLATEIPAAEAEVERLRHQEAEVEDWGELRDVEAEALRHLLEIRQAIAGEVRDAEGIEAVRAALSRMFEGFTVRRRAPGKKTVIREGYVDEERQVAYDRILPAPGSAPLVIQPKIRPQAISGYDDRSDPVAGAPILRREGLGQAENKYAEGLTT